MLKYSNLALGKHQTMETRHQSWHQVKAEIIRRFGSIKRVGQVIDATPEAIRLTAQGKCPHVARRLRQALA